MNKDGQKTNRRLTARRPIDGFTMLPDRGSAAPRRQPVAAPLPTLQASRVVLPELPAFSLPPYQAPARPLRPLRRRLNKRRLLLRTTGLAVALFLATGGFLAWHGYTNFHKVFRGTGTVAALGSKPVAPSLLNGEGAGRVNILLLGVGGPGHDGPDLTDTMVILSVDPVNHTAVLLSIPRDLWVAMPVNYFGSMQKINAAYESGKYHYLGHLDASSANVAAVQAGFTAVDQVLKSVLDIHINYHVVVNFQAFKQAVDTVGGVTVDVPTTLIDPTMAWENANNPIIASAGVQTMNGFHALEYARSRETTSDFARTERQRQLLVALKDKVFTAGTLSNPAKIDGLMNAFGDNVYSDLSTQGALRLTSIMKQVSDNSISSVGLSNPPHQLVTTDHVGNISVVRPLAGFGNYADIQNYVRSQLPDGYLLKEQASVTVVGTTQANAAAQAALLISYGYHVTATTVSTAATTKPVVVDLSAGKDPYTLHYLEGRFATTAVHQLPPGVIAPASGTKFVIIEP